MNRSDLLYVMSLGLGGVPASSALRNSRVLRRALANREHSSACAGASSDECSCSCGGSMHGGGGSGDADALKETKVSAINVSPGGKTFVGFTDRSAEPPRNYYLQVGGEEDGWKVVSADYDSEEAVLEKDGRRIALKLGGVPKEAAPEEEEPEPASGGPSPDDDGDIRSPLDIDGEGFDLGDAWEDFHESGIWSMGDNNRDGILEDIRQRYEQEGDAALEHGERKFLELYEKWESVQSMAGMIVEGGGGGPPPFSETQARMREAVDDPAATEEAKDEAMLVYRAEMEAARRIWEAKAGQAFYTKHGRSPDNEAEAREGERLAGVPYEYEGSLADGYLENRRRCRRRRRELANRVETEALARLANVGWTDEARAAALLARRLKAKEGAAAGAGKGSVSVSSAGSSAASIRAPSPPTEGTIVNVGGWISVMMNGKLVRIGSTKVLCVLPDGQLGVKLGGKAYPIGKPSKWRTGVGGPRIVSIGGKYCLDVGKGYLDLETGQVRVKPERNVPRRGGAVKIVMDRTWPFTGGGVDIPPDPPDISQRRYLQA